MQCRVIAVFGAEQRILQRKGPDIKLGAGQKRFRLGPVFEQDRGKFFPEACRADKRSHIQRRIVKAALPEIDNAAQPVGSGVVQQVGTAQIPMGQHRRIGKAVGIGQKGGEAVRNGRCRFWL